MLGRWKQERESQVKGCANQSFWVQGRTMLHAQYQRASSRSLSWWPAGEADTLSISRETGIVMVLGNQARVQWPTSEATMSKGLRPKFSEFRLVTK